MKLTNLRPILRLHAAPSGRVARHRSARMWPEEAERLASPADLRLLQT